MALIDNLVSHFTLDEASGNRADSHGSNELADVNTVASTTGVIDDAADFIATNSERLNDLTFSLTDNETISISLWAKSTDLSTAPGFLTLAPASTGTRDDVYFRVGTDAISPGTRWRPASTDYNLDPSSYTSTNNDDGNWHHYVYMLYNNGSSRGTIEVYYDGVQIGTTSHASQPFAFKALTKLYVGAHFNNFSGSISPYLTGSIDELGIWDKKLSTDEIAELYNSGAGLAYPFTGGGSSIKTLNGIAIANVKTWNGIPIANIKTWNGISNV